MYTQVTHRILVFDREGWSPAFFAELWREHRIAVISYQKGKFEAWDESDFEECKVVSAFGNISEMKLAQRIFEHPELTADSAEKAARKNKNKEAGDPLKDNEQSETIPHKIEDVKAVEIRRSCDSKSHQTSIITTVRTS